jgi:hypothetical protein
MMCRDHGCEEKIMVMFFKRFIHVNGYRITFESKVLTEVDFRNYKIIVENNYGEGVFNFTLQSASKYIYNYYTTYMYV